MGTQKHPLIAPAPPRQSLWAALKDAIRGTDADYTQIDLKKAILLPAVPMSWNWSWSPPLLWWISIL